MAEADGSKVCAALERERDARYREPGKLRGVVGAAPRRRQLRPLRRARAARVARSVGNVVAAKGTVGRVCDARRICGQRDDVLRLRTLPFSARTVPGAV